MVNYQCYRCGYTTTDKSKIRSHVTRKNPCKVKFLNLNLDDCIESIFNGVNIDEYLESLGGSVNPGKNTQNNTQNVKKTSKNVKEMSKNVKETSKNVKETSKNVKEMSKNVKEMSKNICEYCNKEFNTRQSKWYHLKTCKERKKDEEVKNSMTELVGILNEQLGDYRKELDRRDKQIDKQNKQIDEQNKQIQELIKKAGISNSNNTINIQNNIKLLGYNNTDRSHLTDSDILKCLQHSNFCIPHLIEKIHFDVNKPENHNVYISNLKNKYVMMYDGNKWECKDRDEQINNLIDDNEGIIEYKLEEWIENGGKYPEMMRKFNRYIEKKDNDKVINKIKDEIKLLLYNNRNIVNKEGVKTIEIN